MTTTSGTIAAKISGDTDESGPRTRIREGPIERVAEEAGDRGVEPGDRREAGEFCVGHALRHEDRREHGAGDEVEPEPGSLVATYDTDPGTCRATAAMDPDDFVVGVCHLHHGRSDHVRCRMRLP